MVAIMKKGIKRAALFLLAILVAANVQAFEPRTLTTELQAVIPPYLIVSTDMENVEIIDLMNATSAYLGKVIITTNVVAYWTISIRSQFGGRLIGMTPGNTDTIPYQFAFGSIENIDLSSEFSVAHATTQPLSVSEFPVRIRYARFDQMEMPIRADTYHDFVTITVALL